MAATYRVCQIVPRNYPHAACFDEIAILLDAAIRSLGHECEIRRNQLSGDCINIVLGYHLLRYTDALQDLPFIPYQLEQLSDNEGVFSENAQRVLGAADVVWDYSPENVSFLEERGITAAHLPVGYHAALESIAPADNADIDVLFYGSRAERRAPLLARLEAADDIDVRCLFGVYGAERDALIARSKIVLNVHCYSTQIYEAVRMSYLFNNGCFVLSEESAIDPYPLVELETAPYGELERRCRELLDDNGQRLASARQNAEAFREHYAMTRFLAPLLVD